MTLKRISMRDQVYEIIKNRILSREYSLGEPINIVHLSKELGISTPLSEKPYLNWKQSDWLPSIPIRNIMSQIWMRSWSMICALLCSFIYWVLLKFAVITEKCRFWFPNFAKPLKNSRKCMTLPTAMTMLLHQWISNGLSSLLLIILCWKKHMTLLSPYWLCL